MRPTETYRAARKKAAKKLGLQWRDLPLSWTPISKKEKAPMRIVPKKEPEIDHPR